MMNDTLFEKAALMGSLCFPSDDELEKSGGEELDESQPSKGKKKKKKRSGSLQGNYLKFISKAVNPKGIDRFT